VSSQQRAPCCRLRLRALAFAGERQLPFEQDDFGQGTATAPEAAQRLKAFWAGFAAQHSAQRRPGLFAYNLFAVSRTDLARIQELQRELLRQMRTTIAQSEPTDVVALANLQIFALED
jgi:hypothetical protein